MTFDDKPQLSAAARIDEEHHQRKLAEEFLRKAKETPAPRRSAAPASSTYVTQRELDRVLAKMGQMIGAELKPLRERIAELEAREWAGVWEAGKSYAKGAIVSHGGSGWLALRQYPDGKPGDGANSGWRLIVKRGRDGRDAR